MKKALLLPVILLIVLIAGAEAQTRSGASRQAPTPSRKPETSKSAPAAGAPAEGDSEECGCEGQPQPEVLAVVEGTNVTAAEIDLAIKDRLAELRKQVIEARRKDLDLEINTRLLEAEAKKRGTTSMKILDEEVVKKVQDPTEQEIQEFYEQNKTRIQAPLADVKQDIVTFLRQQRQQAEAQKFSERLRSSYEVKKLADDVKPPKSDADRARVLAIANGERVTLGDVEDTLTPVIYDAQQKIFELRSQELNLRVNDILLEREAQRRKITTDALLQSEVLAKISKPAEEDARKFYDQNKERIKGDFAQVKDKIIEYLEDSAGRAAETVFAEELRKSASIRIFLTESEPPVFKVGVVDRPWKGGANAPVLIVEFTDFECPSCGRTQPILDELLTEYGDKVKLVTRNFPLVQHKSAFKAAEAAEAAREQGKYWEYVATLFTNQQALGVDKLKEYATQLGLDRAKFDQALDSGRLAEKVQRDIRDGDRLGVNSTPTVFVNGRPVKDRTKEGLKAAVEGALKRTTSKEEHRNNTSRDRTSIGR
jgi:protein-disulfide isomerase